MFYLKFTYWSAFSLVPLEGGRDCPVSESRMRGGEDLATCPGPVAHTPLSASVDIGPDPSE